MPLSHRLFLSHGLEVVNTGVTKEAPGFCLDMQVPLQDSSRKGSWNLTFAELSVVTSLLMLRCLMDF